MEKDKKQQSNEKLLIGDFIENLYLVDKESELKKIILNNLKKLIPHEFMICGVANKSNREIKPIKFIRHKYSLDFLKDFKINSNKISSPMIELCLSTGKPQLFYINQESVLKKFNIKNSTFSIILHCQNMSHLSCFSFISLITINELYNHHTEIIEMLMPSISNVMFRLWKNKFKNYYPINDSQVKLTIRESEILQLLFECLSNIDIANRLNISILTVKNHLKNIYPKLNVNNRSNAIIRGLELNLIKNDTRGDCF